VDSQIILEMKHIDKAFPGVQALNDVSLSIKKGEVHGLCGENGAGKSTLLKIATGLYSKDSGNIFIDGEEADIRSVESARKYGIHVVPQEIQILRDLTVAENIFLGSQPTTKLGLIDWEKMFSLANNVKQGLGRHAQSLNVKSKAGDLSMGSWQLIEIMRALIDENIKVLAFDEPTSSLSDDEAESLFELINDLRSQGVAIIYVSHRLKEIFSICDVVTVLKDGEYVDTKKISETTSDELVSMMIGRGINFFGEPKDRSYIKDEIMLKAENFSCGHHYQDVSLELRKGEIVGLYGLVGAGRTEFVRGLFAADKKDSGTLYLKNQKVNIRDPREANKLGMGFVTENRREEGLMLNASLTWNLSMPNLAEVLNKFDILMLNKEKAYADQGISLFDVKTSGREMLAVGLSGGNQQKVVLSKWVMANCDILIVDEPTRGIDVGAKVEVYDALKKLAKEGKSILMVSSELPEILGVSDRIIVMCEGRVTGNLENIDLTEEDVIKYAFDTHFDTLEESGYGE